MSKQLNVKLNFQADTTQVEQALASLFTSLGSIGNLTPTVGGKLTKDLEIAKQSAIDLQSHLYNAFNIKTGNLDLSKLDASLKSAGQNLGQLSTNLLKAGSSGEQAFLNIQRAVGNASVQINQANGALATFMTTLKNTARWQISSSILHGFVSALSSAWGYAKDLDKSLNNIRIVTGYSSEKMAEFAEQANKAARQLSTTTTEYTNASLIYYQQGLSDDEVQKRTDITIKMANAAGESAEKVSNQLTAVWNNFYDGTKSLEYYADVMTALGAATASSTDEIAGGLEKFAAIGETIGLSYEYAASALATITANTRQSEDVVGTALKTIFARIQGLKLGETLEDGVDLNKYSEALRTVGISIFESNGELKKMDDLLDEMGAKWLTLSKAEQTALAQTVAGVRQYTQLVSLMDNWDKGDSDSMMANLETSYNAEGALQEQADIYADSWEAASDRVKAATESIYRNLFPTEELTGLMGGLEIILQGVDGLVQAFGGLEGILLLVSSILLQTFQTQIGASIDTLILKVRGGLTSAFHSVSNTVSEVSNGTLKWHEGISKIFGITGNIINSTSQLRNHLQEVANSSQDAAAQSTIMEQNMKKGVSTALQMSMQNTQAAYAAENMNEAFMQYNTNAMEVNNTQALIEQSSKHLTKEQQKQLSLLQEQAQAANEQLLTQQNTLAAEKQRQEMRLASGGDQVQNLDRYGISEKTGMEGQVNFTSDLMNTNMNQQLVQPMLEAYGIANKFSDAWASTNIQLDAHRNHLALVFDDSVDLLQINKEANATYATMVDASEEVAAAQKQWGKGSEEYKQALQGIAQRLKETKGFSGQVAKSFLSHKRSAESIEKGIAQATASTKAFAMATGSSGKHVAEIEAGVKNVRAETLATATAGENFKNTMAQVRKSLETGLNSAMSVGNVAASMAQGASSIAMGVSSIVNAMETLEDEDASFTTKLTAGAMAATMGIRGLTAGLGLLNTFITSATLSTNLKTAADLASAAASKLSAGATEEEAVAELANYLSTKLNVKEEEAKAKAIAIATAAQKGETGATLKDTIANYANVASQAAKYWYISLIIAAIAALVIGIYALITAEDKEDKALRESSESLKRATDAHNEAREAVTSFQDALSNYKDGVEGLKEVADNAEELEEAVKAVNEQAMELIEKYGLFGKYKFGEFGEIIIDEDALSDIETKLKKWEAATATSRYMREMDVIDRKQDIETEEERKNYTYTTAREYTKSGDGQYATTTYGSYLDNPNTYTNTYDSTTKMGVEVLTNTLSADDLNALANAINDTTDGLEEAIPSADELVKQIENSADAYGLSEGALKDLSSIITDDSIGALVGFTEGVNEAKDASKAYAKEILGLFTDDMYSDAIDNASKEKGHLKDLMYAAKDAIVGEGGATEYTEQRTDIYNEQVKPLLDNWTDAGTAEDAIKRFTSNTLGLSPNSTKDKDTEAKGGEWLEKNYSKIFDGATYDGNINTEQMFKDYYEALGYQILDTKNANGKIEYTYIDPSGAQSSGAMGNKEIQEVWTEYIAEYVIGQKAQDKAKATITPEELEKTFTKIADADNVMGADWSSALLSGIANGKFDFSSIFSQISEKEFEQLSSMDGEELGKLFGLTPEDLKSLGYSSADAFGTAFKEGLAKYDAEDAKLGTEAHYASLAEQHGIDKSEFEAYRDLLAVNKEIAAAYEDNYEGLNKVALANKRMEKGVKAIAEKWTDYNDIMKDSSSTEEDIAIVTAGVKDGLQDILNISSEDFKLLPPTFVQDNWGLIQDVMNNVEGSVDKLRDKAGQEILLNIGANVDLDSDGKLDQAFLDLHNKIANYDKQNFEVGIALDPDDEAEFYASCNEIINAAGMTQEQATAYFANMGYDVEVTEVDAPPKETPWHIDNPVYNEEKSKAAGVPIFDGTETLTGTNSSGGGKALAVKTITPNGSYGGGVGVKTTAPKSATKDKNKGGGGSKPKKAKEVKKTDIVERYKETEDVLDDLRDTLDDVNKATDRLYGASRIKQMELNNKLLGEEVELLKQKKKEAEAYLIEDRKMLNEKASKAGVSLTFDENGNISNYTAQLTQLYNQLDSTIKAANKDGNATEAEQEKIDKLQEKIDELKDAIAQYDETKELIEDLENELDDKFYKWQDQNYEILSYELELKIEINDEELQKLDYYLSKTEEDFYQRAEGIALINDKMGTHTDNLSHYENQIAKLDEAYQKGEISQADYVAGMKELNSSIYDNLSSLQELDKQMMHYYGETLQSMAEEIDKVTEKIEHSAAVLEHYSSLFGLIGRSTDYEKMGTILEGQAEVSKNQMIAAKEEYLNYSQMADEKYQLMMTAETDEAYEMYKQQYEDALAMANEVQEEYLGYAEQYAEQLTAILENSLAKYGQDLENALTGGTSFDQLTSKMERAAALQEEYLTTTNKIYETNKMINTAQQEIDKTTNTVAKQRLKQFINETNQLQKKNKLSQFELDIQQAKYELLLAEIALEEAQDAKSQVRLQRDAEGNFGYVYTADQDKISQAQQELADAQNNLYNISLEGANGYAEKYQQTLNELYDTLTDLQRQYLEGAFESEQEYQNAVVEAKEYYYKLLEDYSDLYTIAISTDAKVLEDSWSREFSSMIYNTDYWKQQVEEYVEEVSDAFKTWEREMKAVASDTGLGGDFENLAEKVGDITHETEQLTEEIIGPLMSSLQQEVDMVNSVTDAYAAQRDELAKVIAHYESLTAAIEDKQRAEMGIIEAKNTAESATPKNSNNSKGSSGNGTPEVGDVVTYTGGKYYHTSGGGSPTGERGPGGRVTITQINPGAKYPIHVWSGDSGYGWLKKEQLSGFDTGGYTGQWGSYGKLAMLHEKELVLNKQDTQNLLQSVELLNNIIQTINLQTANAQLGGLLNSPTLGMPGSNTLDQQVQIEAHFPNVSSRIEIEEAFSTLINRASQYANRK